MWRFIIKLINAALRNGGVQVILITGATGHIGNVLVRKLADQYPDEKLRVFVLPGENLDCFDGLELELHYGDIRRTQDVFRAVRGARLVFHLAGLIDTTPRRADHLRQVNVGGTENIVAASLAHQIERLIYISSVHALPDLPRDQIICETDQFPYPDLLGAYARTKTQATAEVYRGIASGLDAVIIFPSGVIGPANYKVAEMDRLFRYLSRQGGLKLIMAIDGAYDFADVRDVADGIVAAAKHGQAGQGYILSGHHVSIRDIIELERDFLGQKPARIFFAPTWLVRLGARLTQFFSFIFFFKPIFNPYSVSVLLSNCNLSHAKATAELGYQPRPLQDTLDDTLTWLQNRGQIKRKS